MWWHCRPFRQLHLTEEGSCLSVATSVTYRDLIEDWCAKQGCILIYANLPGEDFDAALISLPDGRRCVVVNTAEEEENCPDA